MCTQASRWEKQSYLSPWNPSSLNLFVKLAHAVPLTFEQCHIPNILNALLLRNGCFTPSSASPKLVQRRRKTSMTNSWAHSDALRLHGTLTDIGCIAEHRILQTRKNISLRDDCMTWKINSRCQMSNKSELVTQISQPRAWMDGIQTPKCNAQIAEALNENMVFTFLSAEFRLQMPDIIKLFRFGVHTSKFRQNMYKPV